MLTNKKILIGYKKIHSLIKLYLKKVQTCCKIPIGFYHGDLTFSIESYKKVY